MRAEFSAEDFLPFKGHVYEPADDSFLLVDAILNDLDFIRDILQPQVCLEIGSGSGIVISTAALSLKDAGHTISFHATDINEHAIKATKTCLKLNNLEGQVQIYHTNLADSFRNNNTAMVDLLMSNPPFEPCNKIETDKNKVGCAWTAGATGRMVIDMIIPELPTLMSEKGVFYMAMVADNDLEDVIRQMTKVGFGDYKIILERDGNTSSNLNRIYHEYVVRFSRTRN